MIRIEYGVSIYTVMSGIGSYNCGQFSEELIDIQMYVIGIVTDFSWRFVVFWCNCKTTDLDAIVCAHGLFYFIWEKCWVFGIYRHFQTFFFSAAILIWERKVSIDMMNWPLKHMALCRCLKALPSELSIWATRNPHWWS